MQSINLISDLEKAIAGRSNETAAMLRQITDLFLLNTGRYSAEQLDVYDDVLKVLITRVEDAALTKLAQRLAPVDGAPPNTIRLLALNDAIDVAEPILSQSNVLDDGTLTHCIAVKGQEHLLAIATRKKLSAAVADQLVTRGNRNVLGALACNPGAAISDPSFGILVQKSAGDDWLSECVGRRVDIPERHLRELITKASKIVRQRLMTENPNLCEIIQEILPNRAPSPGDKAPSSYKDYRTAELVVKSKPLTEAVVNDFARGRKLEEIIVSIAQLSGFSTTEIERLFMGTWSSPVAVILKAIGFHLATVDAIYRARLGSGEEIRNDLVQTKAEFIALRRFTAGRIMRFFIARQAVEISNLGRRPQRGELTRASLGASQLAASIPGKFLRGV